MKKHNVFFKFAIYLLFGIFTADLIYRVIRYILAYIYASESFPKIFAVAVAAVGDTYSGRMLAGLIIAALLAVLGGVAKQWSLHTLVFFGINAVSGFTFIAILNLVEVTWNVLWALSIASFGTYIISCVLCEVFTALDLYRNLKLQQGENTDDSTT